MKKVIRSTWNKLLLLPLMILLAASAFAQDESGSIYDVKEPRHHIEMYSGFFPYVVFGVLALFLGYISYRYWKDNRPDDIGHEPHHQ